MNHLSNLAILVISVDSGSYNLGGTSQDIISDFSDTRLSPTDLFNNTKDVSYGVFLSSGTTKALNPCTSTCIIAQTVEHVLLGDFKGTMTTKSRDPPPHQAHSKEEFVALFQQISQELNKETPSLEAEPERRNTPPPPVQT